MKTIEELQHEINKLESDRKYCMYCLDWGYSKSIIDELKEIDIKQRDLKLQIISKLE